VLITTALGGVASYGVDYVRLYDPPALSGSIGFDVVDLAGRASPRVEVALP